MGKKKKKPAIPGSAKSRLRPRSAIFQSKKKVMNKEKARKPIREEDME